MSSNLMSLRFDAALSKLNFCDYMLVLLNKMSFVAAATCDKDEIWIVARSPLTAENKQSVIKAMIKAEHTAIRVGQPTVQIKLKRHVKSTAK